MAAVEVVKAPQAAKAPKVDATGAKKKRVSHPDRLSSFKSFNQKLLASCTNGVSITRDALLVLDKLLNKMCTRTIERATWLTQRRRRETVQVRDVRAALYLLLTPKLAKFVDSKASTALKKYMSSKKTAPAAATEAAAPAPPAAEEKAE